MKKITVVSLALFITITTKAQVYEPRLFNKEKKDTVKNIIKFDVLGARRQSYISYERFLSPRTSLTLGIKTNGVSSLIRYNSIGHGYGGDIGMRYYLTTKKPMFQGLYLSPQLTFNTWNFNLQHPDGSYYKGNSFSAGANLLVGKQVISKRGLVLDVFTGIGAAYNKTNINTAGMWGTSTGTYAGPRLVVPVGINIGFGW